jgi:hypothetical protein
MVRYIAVSSANNLTWEEIFSGRSFMYTKKKSIGANTDPRGTPDVTGIVSDASPSSTTVWVLSLRSA